MNLIGEYYDSGYLALADAIGSVNWFRAKVRVSCIR